MINYTAKTNVVIKQIRIYQYVIFPLFIEKKATGKEVI